MKKFLQSTMMVALMATAWTSLNAETTMYVKDFAIKAGETKTIEIIVDNPDYSFTAFQFDMYLSKGLVFVEEDGEPWFEPTSRIPTTRQGTSATGSYQNNKEYYRYLSYNSKGNYVSGTSGAIFTVDVTTDDTFKGEEYGTVTFKNVKLSDIADATKGYICAETTAKAYEAVSLEEFATTTATKTLFIADDVKVLGTTNPAQYTFVTNGNGGWLKLTGADKMVVGTTYEGCQFGGKAAAGFNPTLAVNNTLGEAEASKAISAEPTTVNLTTSFTLASAEVVSVTGFYFNDDNQETLRAYSGNNGPRGKSLTVDNSWSGGNTMTNGTPYTIQKAAIQLKAAWEGASNGAAMVAPSDANSFQNYVLYPLEMAQIATAVEDLNASKNVSSVRYYNVAGVEAATPFDGMNIIVTTYSDGTTSTAKVVK